MEFVFIPKKLIAAKEDILSQHSYEKEVISIEPDKKLKNLILKLILMDESQIKKKAFSLTNSELQN